jgi:hypothetical protein
MSVWQLPIEVNACLYGIVTVSWRPFDPIGACALHSEVSFY